MKTDTLSLIVGGAALIVIALAASATNVAQDYYFPASQVPVIADPIMYAGASLHLPDYSAVTIN